MIDTVTWGRYGITAEVFPRPLSLSSVVDDKVDSRFVTITRTDRSLGLI